MSGRRVDRSPMRLIEGDAPLVEVGKLLLREPRGARHRFALHPVRLERRGRAQVRLEQDVAAEAHGAHRLGRRGAQRGAVAGSLLRAQLALPAGVRRRRERGMRKRRLLLTWLRPAAHTGMFRARCA